MMVLIHGLPPAPLAATGGTNYLQLELLFCRSLQPWEHGGNDAQKTMGICRRRALYTAGVMRKEDFAGKLGTLAWLIILAANLAIALGTYFGGWRIVHTMG